jgi:hypothetical protein
MAGLVPAIHVFVRLKIKTRMPGTRPGMTHTGYSISAARRMLAIIDDFSM